MNKNLKKLKFEKQGFCYKFLNKTQPIASKLKKGAINFLYIL